MNPAVSHGAMTENPSCAFCTEDFNHLQNLDYGHFFCLNCSKKLEGKKKKVMCPECEHKTDAPSDRAENLQQRMSANDGSHDWNQLEEDCYITKSCTMFNNFISVNPFKSQDADLRQVEAYVKKHHILWEKVAASFSRSLQYMLKYIGEEKTRKSAEFKHCLEMLEKAKSKDEERKALCARIMLMAFAGGETPDDLDELPTLMNRIVNLKEQSSLIDFMSPMYLTNEFEDVQKTINELIEGLPHKEPDCNDMADHYVGACSLSAEIYINSEDGPPTLEDRTMNEKIYKDEDSVGFSLHLLLPPRVAYIFRSCYSMAMNPKKNAVVICALSEDQGLAPTYMCSYDGQNDRTFGEEGRAKLSGVFLGQFPNSSICFDPKREVYVIPRRVRGVSQTRSLLKFNENGQSSLRIKGSLIRRSSLWSSVAYSEGKDAYVCMEDEYSKILFIHPDQGNVIKSFYTPMYSLSDINVGRLEDKEVLLILEDLEEGRRRYPRDCTKDTMQLKIINTNGEVLRNMMVNATVESAEMGPDGIVFLRHKNRTHLSFLSVKKKDANNNADEPQYGIREKLILPPLAHLNEEDVVRISCFRYDHINKKMAVGVTENKDIPGDIHPTQIYLFDVVIHQ